MSTGDKIVKGALQKIGAHSKNKAANSTSLENGRLRLNSFMAELYDEGIILGVAPLEALGNQLGEPMGATNAIEDNLAILLQPDHEGATISQQLRINASNGMAMLRRRYKTITIPKQVIRSTMPKGAGNRDRQIYDDIYFKAGETIGD
jgi:hypothetical protein